MPAATTAGEGWFLYREDTGGLFWDADGSGKGGAVLIATLTGAPVITDADFDVVSDPLLV